MKRELPTSIAKLPSIRAKAAKAAKPRSKPAEAENWDVRLGFLMHDVSRLRRVVFDEFMKPIGLTRSQWWTLAHLSRHDGMVQSDLANLLEIGKASLGGLIDRLELSKFIERRADESDRRIKRIHLTPAGAQIVDQMRGPGHAMSERVLAGLDTESRHTLVNMLSLIKSNLRSIKSDAQAG